MNDRRIHTEANAEQELTALRERIADLEQALALSEDRFRKLSDSAPVGLFLDDTDGKAIFINKKCAEILGVRPEEALDLDWIPILHPDDRDQVVAEWEKTFTSGGEFRMEYRYVHADGRVVWVLGEVVPIFGPAGDVSMFIGSLTDITARKQGEEARAELEGQLLQAQKMESIGRLAGGVAHDFNNLLMGVLSYVDLCSEVIDAESPAQAWLADIKDRAGQSATVVDQLLAFARKQTIQPRAVDLNSEVSRSLGMLRKLLGERIELVFTPADEPAYVRMDPVQVHQIIINLSINAQHAIASQGRILIEIEQIEEGSEPEPCEDNTLIPPCVLLRVSDTGCGIAPEALQQIFDPFFTTKPDGEGTGLGLASVYGIVKQNGGRVDVSSTVDAGTTFSLQFPSAETPCADAPRSPSERTEGTRGGDETILLVEDEPSIQKALRIYLERLGYTVLSAAEPVDALRVARECPGDIHALVSDVVMPGMNGDEVARQLRARSDTIKVILMSGYTRDSVESMSDLPEDTTFLRKPFRYDQLAETLRKLLDAGTPG